MNPLPALAIPALSLVPLDPLLYRVATANRFGEAGVARRSFENGAPGKEFSRREREWEAGGIRASP